MHTKTRLNKGGRPLHPSKRFSWLAGHVGARCVDRAKLLVGGRVSLGTCVVACTPTAPIHPKRTGAHLARSLAVMGVSWHTFLWGTGVSVCEAVVCGDHRRPAYNTAAVPCFPRITLGRLFTDVVVCRAQAAADRQTWGKKAAHTHTSVFCAL